MPLYRIYTVIKDEFGQPSYARVGKTYAVLHKAMTAARKVSETNGIAELKDDSRSIYDRLLTIFRDGRQVGAV